MNEAEIELAKSYIQSQADPFVKDNAVQLYPVLAGFAAHLVKAGKFVDPEVLKKDVIRKRIVHAACGTPITIETCDLCGGEKFKLDRPADE